MLFLHKYNGGGGGTLHIITSYTEDLPIQLQLLLNILQCSTMLFYFIDTLHACENWILTDPFVDQLEAFQGDIGRIIFKLPKFNSTISTHLALKWPSIATRILILKLSLLLKISSDGGSVASRIYFSLTAKDSQLLRILHEYKSLEDKLGSLGATNTVINAEASMKEVKWRILKVDWDTCLSTASEHNTIAVSSF